MIRTHTFEVEGKTLSLEVGRVAKQAGGAVLLGMGETVVLATATMSQTAREGIDFLPLVCDYEERKYALGKIPGGFMKRGGRPSEKSILISRLIDRPIRPLFPKGLRNEVQVIAMPFANDPECPPDVLSICAAGAALSVSDIPFKCPVAGVRVGRIDGKFILFPTSEQINQSDLDLIVAGHEGAVSMIEAGAKEISEKDMIAAIKFAHDAIKVICNEISVLAKMVNKPKTKVTLTSIDENLIKDLKKAAVKDIKVALSNPDKATRESALSDLEKELITKYTPEYEKEPEKVAMLSEAIDSIVKETVRTLIIKDGKRPDGRRLDEIRPLEASVGLLPRVHGSGMFTRGQTQVMTILTLGMPNEAQSMDEEEDKRYMHFYNFPPYSVGEARPMRGPGRREIGHGALAERALMAVIPFNDPEFPYTMHLVSEVLESNGSTSMASVCGSTLALMDAGVPIKAPVAGIAMGLMSDGKTFTVLTDIQGMEDFLGDMDFKVAGTKEGITALQLDTKLDGIPDEVLEKALNQALDARLQILEVITEEISETRDEISPRAPRLLTIHIQPEKIGALIGPGGAMIRKITSETNTSIDVQQDGRVLIGSTDGVGAKAALAMIEGLTKKVEVGNEFQGKVVRIIGRGAFVEYMPGRDALVPVEHISPKKARRIEDIVNIGDTLSVKVIEVDNTGRVTLTALGLAQVLPTLSENESAAQPEPQTSRGRDFKGGDRGGHRGDDRSHRGGDRDRGGDRGGDRSGIRGSGNDRSDNRSERKEQNTEGNLNQPYNREHAQSQGRNPDKAHHPFKGREDFSEPKVDVPEEFPNKQRSDDSEKVVPRFRPRR